MEKMAATWESIHGLVSKHYSGAVKSTLRTRFNLLIEKGAEVLAKNTTSNQKAKILELLQNIKVFFLVFVFVCMYVCMYV